ncbi:MAG: hypothetical protein IKV43_03255 [Clostridia bacterium]|nr:hypothetical protein [Clostridia bacterium]
MNSLELTSAVTTLANAIACKLTLNEIALIAGLFVQLGDTLATIAASQALCEERAENQNCR